MSTTLSSLLADYRQGKRTPSEVLESLRPAQDNAYASAWICRAGPDALARRARQLEQMVRDPGHGSAIEVEVWRLPAREYGSFVAGIPSPLGIGQVELGNGEWVQGFVCEGWAVQGAEEISQLGGWRAYLAQKAAH